MGLELCKGIAIIIDDKVIPAQGEANDHIVKIANKLKQYGVPYCAYTKLSEARTVINNLGAVNFLILDWDLTGDLDADGEDVIKPSSSHRVVKFIKDFQKICFCPIFIFSNAGVDDIKDTLIKEGLFYEGKKNFIHIQNKGKLIKGKKLFSVINKWVNENPTIYSLKNWENAFLSAKNDTFWHLFSKSPVWPKILWESFVEDSVDPPSNLNEMIYRLVHSRTSLINLDVKKIKRRGKINVDEVKDVIQGTMYIDKSNIPAGDFRPGDIFKKQGDYFINIRPECDTVIGRDGCDGMLYLLKGSKLTSPQFRKRHYNKKYGVIKDHVNFLLYGLEGKDFVRFNLKELVIANYSEFPNRLCRLLSPYVNDVQQQFSSYVGRFGIPRIPNKVLRSIR